MTDDHQCPAARRTPHEVALRISSEIGRADEHSITVRGHDLVEDLIGEVSYAQMALLTITGQRHGPAAGRVVDAVLVSLIEHGLTPSALATRLTFGVAPEALQAAVVAGLLGSGSVLLGSMEGCGRLLSEVAPEIKRGIDPVTAVDSRLGEIRNDGRRVPGLGHSLHRDGDPRVAKLLAVAEREGYHGCYVELLHLLVDRWHELTGRRLPPNATGAAAAMLLELGVPWQLHRGFALMSRTAGLVAHVGEEIEAPLTPEVRDALREASRPDGS